MKITDIDYYAEYGKSWLNRLSTRIKMLAVLLVIATVVISSDIRILGGLYLALLLVVTFSSVPKLKIIKISLYPLIFLILFLVSIKNIVLQTALIFIFKALSAATSLVLLVFTTNYIKIFGTLSKIMPTFLVNVLFLTYRSLFILAKTFESLMDVLKFRGLPAIKRPILFLKTIGNLVGFFVIKSMETGENLYDAMKLRGYSDSFTYLKNK